MNGSIIRQTIVHSIIKVAFGLCIFFSLIIVATASADNLSQGFVYYALKSRFDREFSGIKLKIPKRFLPEYAQDSSVDGLNFFLYYPGFTALRDRINARNGLDCAGYCGGRLLISLEYLPNAINDENKPNLIYRSLLNDSLNRDQNSKIMTQMVQPPSGYDIKILRNYLTSPEQNEEYYFIKSHILNETFNTSVKCSPNAIYPNCKIEFPLSCMLNISAKISAIKYDQLSNVRKIKMDLDRFISSFIESDKCKTI